MTPDAREGHFPEGDLEIHGRLLTASNATFAGEIAGGRVVYKPVAGERPLWDFPDGTLAGRERATYLVSEALGWSVVPPTILRDGPHGWGMVQLWKEVDDAQHPVDVVPAGAVPAGMRHVFDGVDAHDRPVSLVHEDTPALRRMALLDVVCNNADRKGGHVLGMEGGQRFGVDHGLTFHVEAKLRTVLWGWMGEPLDEDEIAGLARLREWVGGPAARVLEELLRADETEALVARLDRLLAEQAFPEPAVTSYPVIPWPPF